MIETCIVPNCNSGHEISEKAIAFFNVPENKVLQKKWIDAIPKSSIPLSPTGMVCEKHFIESDVIRYYVLQDAAGNVVEKVAYDYPRLVDTAVPLIFPGFELRPNEPKVENSSPLPVQNASDVLYDYMLMDTISDVGVHVIGGALDAISKVAYHTEPHKVNGPEAEVVSQVTGDHVSESHPLVGNGTSHNVSSPVNDDIPGDAVNQTTNSLDVFQSDNSPITTEPLSRFTQPTSAFISSDKIVDGGTNDDDGCCECDDGCCDCDDCGDCCGDGDSCVLS